MQYIKCLWKHNFPNEPILLYSEIDGDRYETRKVEYYADNSFGIASQTVEIGSTALGTVPGICQRRWHLFGWIIDIITRPC